MSPFSILKFSLMLAVCGAIYVGYDRAKAFMEEHREAQEQVGANKVTIENLNIALDKEKEARQLAENQQIHAEAVADAVTAAAQVRAPVYREIYDYAKAPPAGDDGPTAPVLRNTIDRLSALDAASATAAGSTPVVDPEDRPQAEVVQGLAPSTGGPEPAKQRRWWDPRSWP